MTRLVYWLSLAWLVGCTFPGGSPATVNECSGSGDCGSGESCDSELASCVSDEQAGYQVVLRVLAPGGAAAPPMAPVRFAPFVLGGAVVERDLKIAEPSVVRGAVALVSEDGSRQPLTADLVLTPTQVTAGPPADPLSVASASVLTPLDSGGEANYAVSLAPATSYELSVRPFGTSSSLVPPRQLTLTENAVRSGRVDILYDSLVEVRGRIRTQDDKLPTGMDAQGNAKPLRLAVRVLDAETLEPVSSRGVTDEQGVFVVQMDRAPSLGEVLFEFGSTVVPTEAPSGSETPEELTVAAPDFGTLRIPGEGTELEEETYLVGLPQASGQVQVRGRVEGPGPDFDGVQGASVRFDGRLPYLSGDTERMATLARIVESAGSGLFSIPLWPGTYGVVVVPPVDRKAEDLAPLTRADFEVFEQAAGSQGGAAFTLPKRALYEGRVTDSMDRALSGVAVRVAAVTADRLPPVAAYGRSEGTTTQDDGRYELPVDVGLYDWVFEPGEAAAYPWRVLPERRVGEDVRTGEINAKLPAPVVLTGVVAFESGRFAAGASISAFTKLESGRYVQIGRTLLGEQGSYRLYLPATAPD